MSNYSGESTFNVPLRTLFLPALTMFATQHEARAYTDPGTGALIWQMALAGMAAIAFYFRSITSWLKN